MTDLLLRPSGEVNIAPKMRVNGHGWVEYHDESGSIVGLTPPHQVEDLLVGVERWTEVPDDFGTHISDRYEVVVEEVDSS